ncbi:molybdopterin cofactor-binding domain-containing protein [Cohnella thailandensis]|uniref:Molybdopterin-dependent oxidoreductase n=1 Tax=Cohnella thailandensis TaxID=557557 RepID=A0A841SZF5_9BACL|nr:molybdopterin cofactor-binding domain-containing protein [Cohnella thailandensis]MBB6636662.1 molybdopterin-dependent oxidoreductase [Cohnella thailandensis]MBP1973462.1 xanthine dehydrogenase D subunit [Cohnella thailandensis]
MLNRASSGSRWRERPDGRGKVTGELAYLTDRYAEGSLIGRILRSPHPFARIKSIDTEAAKAVPGVLAVLTHEDVPGVNRFGIVIQDQPVLCEDVVRYVGDAVAAVAAETDEAAERALGLIRVEYEVYETISSPEEALRPDGRKLHPDGNVLKHIQYSKGDVEEAFGRCAHIVEQTYKTPRQMHVYMETEGGLFVPEPDGRLTVYSPTQHGLKDRVQIANILAVPEENIRVLSSPIGGSFGGKDELNVQPYGALLAQRTGRPVRIHNSRAESVRAGIKRHPMTIRMKTGIDSAGRILAHKVSVLADTGAYATLGGEVLTNALENSLGCYVYENLEIEGKSVFTNNGVSGEFRGFGANQAIFALEGQMDRLAELSGIDPWKLRGINLRKENDPGAYGQEIYPTDGARQVWRAVLASSLKQEESRNRQDVIPDKPWIKTGYGSAIAMMGTGLGKGIPDPGGGRISLAPDGQIEVAFSYEEFGQGLLAALELMLIEHFGLFEEDLRLVIGDTDRVPESGSSTAARTTTMMWLALGKLVPEFKGKLFDAARERARLPSGQLTLGQGGIRLEDGTPVCTFAELAASGEPIVCEMSTAFPESPNGDFANRFLFVQAGTAVRVEVNELTGRVRLLDQYHAVAGGPVANPQGFLGQIEGASGMALGFTLTENAVMKDGRYAFGNLDAYLIPTIVDQSKSMRVEAIEEVPEGDPYGPRGIGEIGSVTLAPAIAQAIWNATGVRVSELPVDPALLQKSPQYLQEAVQPK